MKYFISILFVTSVLFSEVVVTLVDITNFEEICLIDLNKEGRSNKDSSEQESAKSTEDDTKIEVKDFFVLSPSLDQKSTKVSAQNLPQITHYLEIHPPPPEQI